jgi:hypothetical protein
MDTPSGVGAPAASALPEYTFTKDDAPLVVVSAGLLLSTASTS